MYEQTSVQVGKKDKFTVAYNPNNWLRPFELWVKGERQYYSTTGVVTNETILRKVAAYRKEDKAIKSMQYWQGIQQFSGEDL